MSRRRLVLIGLSAVIVIALSVLSWQGVRALMAWNRVERVAFDVDQARGGLPSTTSLALRPSESVPTTGADSDPATYRTVLVVGSDERDFLNRARWSADAIVLYLMPDDESGAIVVSVPRDMIVVDPCTGTTSKINRMLVPCGDSVSDAEHVAIALEDQIGIPIDHFALIEFEAFATAVDSLGGVELCLDYAMREGDKEILPAGCSVANGEQAYAYIRPRLTQEYVDGEWVFSENLGDLARIERRTTLMFALLSTLKGVRSPTQLAAVAEKVGNRVVLSDTLGLGEAVDLAWGLRSLPASAIRTITIPAEPETLEDGSYAVRATATLFELIGDGGG